MLDPRRRLLLSEIELQCAFVLRAYSGATTAVERRNPEAFWFSLQALLAAAAYIHRFLAADPDLRALLGVADDSPLRQPALDPAADIPAAFQRWLSEHPRGPLRLSNFGPFGVSHADPAAFERFLDVDQSIAIVFGASYDIAALLAATAGLSQNVKAELRRLQEVV
jgi:hypothetical protein